MGKNLRVHKDCRTVHSLETNRGELFQVITNIFSNAIDASYNGGIIAIGSSEESNGICITIDDEGVGIPKDVEETMFQAFVTTKKDVGTGLGLWVSERLVAKHGGRITVRSLSAGRKGSSFKVWLPRALANKNGNAAASSAS
jgi:signal transduction histidine kinase